jgi:thiol:disulfide interchange protein
MQLHIKFWLSLCLLLAPMIDTCVNANTVSPYETPAPAADPVKSSLLHEETSIQPGRPFFVAIELKIEDDWHLYWKNPGKAGMPPSVTWNLPEGFVAGPLIWPTPEQLGSEKEAKFGYTGTLTLLAQIIPPKSYTEKQAKITADVKWVVCSDSSCLPGDTQIALHLPVKANEPEKTTEHHEVFTLTRSLVPKKYDAVTAKRREGKIEISFYDSTEKIRQIKTIEFFPEHQKAIDLSIPANLHHSLEESNLYTLEVKELSAQKEIKGILVLHTSTGKEAYEIQTPVVADNDVIGMSTTLGAKEGAYALDQERHHNSFEFEGGVLLAIAFAFIGGMILNLMPCVLPVISFKVLGFVKMAGESRRLIFKHGVAFSLGVLLSFWALAALLLALQAYGRAVGWGFQLQEPLFVAILAAFLFIFGLSLFGVFELGTSLMSAAGNMQQKTNQRNQLLSSFFSGILATAVATPCTGPFLGSAVGFAVTLPSWQAMLIFTSLGLGMSFPYLLLGAFPGLLRLMPKPGPWMVTFKELMGFLMMASVIWLIWVFGAQTGSFAVSILLASLFLFALACWIYGRWATPLYKKLIRRISTLIATLLLAVGGYILTMSTSPWVEAMDKSSKSESAESEVADAWEEFSPERVAELRAQGVPVFIDFTAKWCLICQTNKIALSTDEVSGKFKERGVVKMKADWTKKDEMIAAELRKFGRNSVPLYVLYDKDPESDPQILPQVLTPTIVLDSLDTL